MKFRGVSGIAALLALAGTSSAMGAQTGFKSYWKIDVYQGLKAVDDTRVGTLSFISSRLVKAGEFFQLSPNSLAMIPKVGFEGLNLNGRLSVFMEELSARSGRLELDVWDTSSLDHHSPFFKSMFTSSHRLQVGESQDVTFSQGDASVSGGAARYLVRLKLEKVEACDEETSCR